MITAIIKNSTPAGIDKKSNQRYAPEEFSSKICPPEKMDERKAASTGEAMIREEIRNDFLMDIISS